MNVYLDRKRPHRTVRSGKTYAIVVWAIVFLVCIGVIIYIAMKPGPEPPDLPVPPHPPVTADRSPATAVQLAVFFDREVAPAIAAADKANRAAARRCLARLKDMFDRHRKGIPAFTEDMTSLGTRFGVLRRMPGDWWNERNDVRVYIGAKFEKHIFSADSLEQDVESALATFRQAIEANNNHLLTEVRAAVSRSDLPHLSNVDYGDFSSDLTRTIQDFAAASAKDSVTNAILTELASGVGGAAATQLVVLIGTRIATMAASSSAAAGGATAAGAAAGTGGGSLGGPAVAAVGFGVGLAVGIIIDWWMTAQFEEKLNGQLNEMVDGVEKSLVSGAEGKPGLRASLDQACDLLSDAYRESLHKRIVKEPVL